MVDRYLEFAPERERKRESAQRTHREKEREREKKREKERETEHHRSPPIVTIEVASLNCRLRAFNSRSKDRNDPSVPSLSTGHSFRRQNYF